MFWNAHEPKPTPGNPNPDHTNYDFSGRHDLFGFIAAAGTSGLHVILRIGPYVCAEVSYGGFPQRLREVPNIEFRTWNEPFMNEVEKWVRYVSTQLHARKLMAPQGGPVILVQLENEYSMISEKYGEEGEKYLQWVSDLQKELKFGVPGIMCYGSAEGVIETINSFKAHEEIEAHRKQHPNEPVVWTECWTGWYDVWGAAKHGRNTQELMYYVARFFAEGGGGINYYMWMGGTNWGRDGMYLQKSSYDYDAPIDEFYRCTEKSRKLKEFHKILCDFIRPTLCFERFNIRKRLIRQDDSVIVAFEFANVAVFYCNDTNLVLPLLIVGVPLQTVIQPKSVQIRKFGSNELLFDSFEAPKFEQVSEPVPAITTNSNAWIWKFADEPIPTVGLVDKIEAASLRKRNIVRGDYPPEQLAITRDASDYCFYTTEYEVISACNELVFTFDAGDYAHIYINGVFAGRTDSEAPWEDRYTNAWTIHQGKDPGMEHSVRLNTTHFDVGTRVAVTFLVVSLGLVKGDWQLGSSAGMELERKGLLSEPKVQGDMWRRVDEWFALPHTHGECVAFEEESEFWECAEIRVNNAPCWWRTRVKVKSAKSWQLNLEKQGKGMIWVNGFCVGRFWNILGVRDRCGFLDGSPIVQVEKGEMCQRKYHVPGWMVNTDDVQGDEVTLDIVLFDEFGCIPTNGENLLSVVVPQE